MTIYNLVEGWTDPIDCILEADGVALNLTGYTVTMVACDKSNTALTVAGTVTVVSAATGQVRYTPTSSDVLLLNANSKVYVRWKITAAGKSRYIPNGEPDQWIVRKNPS